VPLQWKELELKIRQFESLLHAPPALAAAPNVNALWARLMVEELCRCGVTTFAIAPGAYPAPCRLPLLCKLVGDAACGRNAL